MAEQLGELKRTHTCGALRASDVGTDVVLLGWVHRVRDLGGLLFVEAVNLGAIMVTAFTAPGILRNVQSLNALVGRSEELPLAAAEGPQLRGVQAVVLGDSRLPSGMIEVSPSNARAP